jgi:hypothetical protein
MNQNSSDKIKTPIPKRIFIFISYLINSLQIVVRISSMLLNPYLFMN